MVRVFYAPHEDAGRARWGVVCTCLEPTPLVVAFAAHHLALGASEVRLYLDAPQPDLEALLARMPGVITRVCDNSYWQDYIGRRPHGVEFRQLINAYDAYELTELDWLAHLDADEFLHADIPMGDILAAQPREIDFVRVEPRERAFVSGVPQEGIFDGVFRQPTPHLWGEAKFLFGEGQQYLRQGVLGHPHGKSFMRTGQHMIPGIHSPRRPREHLRPRLKGWVVQRCRLLHFDGLTALHWSGKLLRAATAGWEAHLQNDKSRDKHRARQVYKMRQLGTNLPNAWKMHELLKCVPQNQLDRLRALAMVEEYDIDPGRDIAALGLAGEVDLSRAAFDRALQAQTPQVAEWLTEWEGLLAQSSLRATGT